MSAALGQAITSTSWYTITARSQPHFPHIDNLPKFNQRYVSARCTAPAADSLQIFAPLIKLINIPKCWGEAPEKASWLDSPIQPVLNQGWRRVIPADIPCPLKLYPCRPGWICAHRFGGCMSGPEPPFWIPPIDRWPGARCVRFASVAALILSNGDSERLAQFYCSYH